LSIDPPLTRLFFLLPFFFFFFFFFFSFFLSFFFLKALYKANLFDGCTYSSDDGDCEHVHLHRCMKAVNPGARFFMLPSMRIVYDLDQGEIAGYNVKIKRR